ncbi:probable inactive leucine-rich repeat receptor-like protein kinase At3g03770 [Salvia miltiorrhiza]|uniref:probable inactive leucine-rich repeat receptor-like protein kinase At3g03770 n=1 Tax=Salvia miltiorrhiza TaxID=226208 RepID=UPI0025ABD243|nr:probable inactive leucine-rich repeat receptor-like protein kinase At3g03770 [Salvia miltiorrhiza]
MAKARIFLFIFMFLVHPIFSNQLGNSQFQTLVRIKQLLNFPEVETSSWSEVEDEDVCNTEATQILSLACYEGNITQLHITGNYWFPHLSQDFSAASLFSNIAQLPNLKVLSLVSLGLEGPLPPEIGGLVSLEILNVTSNMFHGSIPREMSFIRNLQTLILDHNRFEGEIPNWIGSLPALRVLSVKNNSFSGSFPRAFSSMVNLRALVLTANNLSGEVAELHNLTNLQVLDLEDNNLGPHFPSVPPKLVSLVLRKNRFHSTLSADEVGSWYRLQKLDISSNELVGAFPPSLLSLPSLTYLDIGGNKLSGKLLHNLSCNGGLTFVNLSENRLTGDLPDCLNQFGERVVLYDGNCLSQTPLHPQKPVSFCHSEALAVGISPLRKEKRRPYGAASALAVAVVGTAALVGLTFLFVKRELAKRHHSAGTRLIVDKASPALTLQLLKDARYISETMKMGALGLSPYRTFVVDELKEATDNFNALHLIGAEVYKGWMTDGTAIAIRRVKVKRKHSIQTYTHQLEVNSKLRHSHLVSAIGHCFECHQGDSSVSRILLVSEYVPNGTLRKYISGAEPGQRFGWRQRIAAGIGLARGILFLHTGIVPGLYANRLKITDVLLDHSLRVKIKKFNLPLLAEQGLPKFGSMSGGEEQHDVYDFGVILLEMIVGRAINSPNDINISKDILSVSLTADLIARRSIVDPAVHKECSDESLKTLMELCLICLSNEPHERPSMEGVVWNLQFAAQVEDTWRRDSTSNQSSPCQSHATPAETYE